VTVLCIRTDKPLAELYLFDQKTKLADIKWEAHRQLAETLHSKIEELLTSQNQTIQNLEGIVIYKGPGSFTGLRIGFSVANAYAYALQIPAVSCGGEGWIKDGIDEIKGIPGDKIALPEYGNLPNVTLPQK
jgi:tRNA threonylcarbamoyladenosine biosynthesis protein TsaB